MFTQFHIQVEEVVPERLKLSTIGNEMKGHGHSPCPVIKPVHPEGLTESETKGDP